MISGLYVGLATALESLRIYILEVFIPASVLLGVLTFVIFTILLIFVFPVAMAILRAIGNYAEAKKMFKQKQEIAAGSEAISKLIGSATKKS